MRIMTALAIAAMVSATQVGCEEKAPPPDNVPPPASESGINIRWPGGSVQVDPSTGQTNVDAGGVNVDAGPGKGATVRTPRVNVDAGGGRGVKVDAPNVDVDVQRQ